MTRLGLLALAFVVGLALPVVGAGAAEDSDLIRAGREAAKVCKACHHFTRERRKFGPHLVKVVGRPVASADKYPYSDAMQALGGTWTEARLAEFLNDPDAFAPGAAMKFPGYKDMAKAKAAAAYFASLARR